MGDCPRFLDPDTVGTQTYSSFTPTPGDSDNVIAAEFAYDGYGRRDEVTNNLGKVTKTVFDETTARVTHVIENYLANGGTSYWGTTNSEEDYDKPLAARAADQCRVTKMTYTAAGQLATLVALDPAHDGWDTGSDDQTTTYTYSTGSTSDSIVPRKDVLVKTKYPDGDDSNDNVQIDYYANGAVQTRTDQRGTVHTYEYDTAGRLTKDRVTTGGTGVDTDWVQSLVYAYDDDGRLETVSSYSGNDGDGTLRNQVQFAFDGWGALTDSYQAHGGAVNTGTSPDVQYGYDTTGFYGTRRLDQMTYPNGRTIHYGVGGAGYGEWDQVRWVASAASPALSQKFVIYDRMGDGTPSEVSYPNVTVDDDGLELAYGWLGADGWDRFGRITQQEWATGGDAGDIKDIYNYGYDRGSNRTHRENTVSDDLDEAYAYDDLSRLTTFHRGDLDGSNEIPVGDRERGAAWTLTQTGNWEAYQLDANGDGDYTDTGAEEVDQDRTHNTVNEIYNSTEADAITESASQPQWIAPVYDAAGNMVEGPRAGITAETTAEETRLHFVYDAWNRLTAVWEDDGDGTLETGADPDDTLVARYRHDGLHRRIAKLLPTAFDGGNNPTTWDRTDTYYTRSWQPIEDRWDDGISDANKDAVVTDVKYQYVWGDLYIDNLVLRDENTDIGTDNDCTEAGDERLYYTHDANFNITAALVEGASDWEVAER